jgi:hypothetical protein
MAQRRALAPPPRRPICMLPLHHANPTPTPTPTPTPPPPPTPTPNQGKSLPLHYAVYRSGPEEVVRLLLEAYPDGAKAVNQVEAPRP